ncbi:LysM peptidoglycan-binding domain-containing protein [Acinetobacter bohemicus]|uniref:lytic transglycosylase n=1 Tax=Acinetobacter TaxID=469 RepID=UPI00209B123E|nr:MULTISPECIES: LysM peptidoglycan-binding domain-containing protein [Acinetobacter]MCO8041619.1 LysM peptidoglycan-binding domain-containing protein [Acinetobacter sp. S4400-12]MCU7223643.1 LysM peptidoglycan-binding domain-containing protein [Acinetobacter bohemicus]
MYKPTATLWQPDFPILLKLSVLGTALASLGLTGCSSTQSATQTGSSKKVSSQYLDANGLDGLEDLLSATDMRAVEGDRLQVLKHGDIWKRMTVGFKMDLTVWNPRIDAQRGWFISRQPYLDRLSARASRYLYHTVKEAERRGMPTELALLPIIESSYDPAATSSAAAAGLWQFIPSTGRIYGLKQTPMYDGRRDVVESTRAAYEFLGSLYNQFGSWELALASYNAGPGRIQQAINRNKAAGLPTDYWSLKLPQETMNYVPRFLAVAQIVKNPNQYGVSLPPIANRPHFREVNVGASSLNEIAAITGLSRAELYQLNPGHRGERIDPQSPRRILIPADLSPSIDEKLKKLSGSGGLLASAPSSAAKTSTTTVLTTRTPSAATTSKSGTVSATAGVVSKTASSTATQVATNSGNSLALNTKKVSTPKGSTALADFAAQSDLPIPSAPRIPVAVRPDTPVKPVQVEPPISAAEREKIQSMLAAESAAQTVEDVLQPVATTAERDEVVEELKALAPAGTEIVDPYDGKIKLTAIQTSLSVAEQQGKELTKGFSYPKQVAENTQASSVEAQLNQGKNYVKTDSEVVVVPPKGKRSTYTVVAGDTLALIAAKNGVSWRDVAKWNQIDPSATLYVGTTIYLYDAKPVQAAPKAKEKPDSYVVQANDSLTSVASQFGLSLQQLADFNDLAPSSGLFVGQKLALKQTATKAKAEDNKKAETVKIQTKSYTVKRGEYLKLIADRYALSNGELAALTLGLTAGSSLLVGQKINVPLNEVAELTTSGKKVEQKFENVKVEQTPTENYQVKRGETLYSIASQSKLSVSELAALNSLSANSGLRIGQTIKIPAASRVPETYTVQAGDTLTGITAKYNLSMDQIADLNNISRTANLRVGQRLKLSGEAEPVQETQVESSTKNIKSDTHVVKSGETLTSIARQYHLQQKYLADLNGLKSNSSLRIGQRLKIEGQFPADKKVEEAKVTNKSSASKATESYTVKSGESLNAIAKRLGISVSDLAGLNNLGPRAGLRVGQTIQIPKLVTEYKIQRGDTLIGLAARHGLATDELAEMNEIKPNTQLRIGEVIKVPN